MSDIQKAVLMAVGYPAEMSDDAFALRCLLILEDATFWSLCERNYEVVGELPDGELFQFTLENLTEPEKQSLRERLEARAAGGFGLTA
jgi:hypothetical protein